MKTKFYIRNGKVQVRINLHGSNIRISTGIDMPRGSSWNEDKEEFVGSSNVDLLREKMRLAELCERYKNLDDIRDNYNMVADVTIHESDSDLISRVTDYRRRVLEGKIKNRKTKLPLAHQTRHSTGWILAKLIVYAEGVGSLNLLDYDMSSSKTIQEKRKVEREWQGWWNDFLEMMTDEEILQSTRSLVMNNISSAIRTIGSEMYISLPAVPSVSPLEKAVIVIQPEDVPRFVNDSDCLYDSFDLKYKHIWELCAVMILSTMRAGDAASLSMKHMTERDGILYLNKRNQKTGANTLCPLTPHVSAILIDNYRKTGHIYSRSGSAATWLLTRIHEFFAQYEFARKELTISVVDFLGRERLTTKPLHEWITSHTMRKTGITSMLYNGVSADYVRLLSGHRPGSKAFERYKGWVDSNYNDNIAKYHSTFLMK
jgi:hypothetical protein